MIYACSNTSQSVGASSNLIFNNIIIDNSCTESITAGTGSIKLNKTGYYKIDFNADGATSGSAGTIGVQMYSNGVLYAGAEASGYSASSADSTNLSFSTIIKVLPNCCVISNNNPLTITFQNSGLAATYSNIAVTVNKI